MVADWSGTLLEWEAALSGLKARIGGAFKRSEARETAGAFIDGLLSGVERKTGWLMAEQAGLDRPYRIQSLLGRGHWSADELRDIVRDYVFEAVGDADGVLVVDETGFVKKGEHSAGVARQYSGAAGRIENSQVGVFVAYASRFGQALIDRRLYLPEVWAGDTVRRAKAHVPEEVMFATKIEMAREMIASALEAGARCRWVLADALYGGDSKLRRMLEARRQPYVLAIRSNQTLRMITQEGLVQTDPKGVAEMLHEKSWTMLAAGEGSKGLRLYDWARYALPWIVDEDFERWVLIRRSGKDSAELAYYFVFAPKGATLAELAGAAGLRWTVEECFERGKSDLGLDHCEARSWHGWHRHMTLVMAAGAFLAKLAADLRRSSSPSKANERSPNREAVT
jgi:SRSO17 transposase